MNKKNELINHLKKISSKDNKLIKEIKKLEQKKYRKEQNSFIIEGKKLVKEAIDSKIKIKTLFIKEGDEFDFGSLSYDLVYLVPENIMSYISTTENPPPVLAIAEIFERKKELKDCNFVLLLDDIQDPGNLGTIIRTSEATGVDLLICSENTVDFFNPKVIRGSMGSAFRQNFLYTKNLENTIKDLIKNNFDIIITSSYAKENYFSIKFDKKTALFVGNESKGVSKELLSRFNSVKIPMFGKVESLNVSIATSILLYEISKYIRK
ncbi:MAG: RNA methyltransferase [Candidatus Sericytochromatia bacterium]